MISCKLVMFHSQENEQLSGIISQVTYVLNFRSARLFFFICLCLRCAQLNERRLLGQATVNRQWRDEYVA